MKRCKSSTNQSKKKSRRSSFLDQSQFDQTMNEETIEKSNSSSNESETLSFPNWLNIPLEVWDVEICKNLGLKQVAIMRGVNRYFEPCWMHRFTLNLVPLRIPYDIGTLDRAMRVIEILIDRKPYTKENPLVVELDKGEHRISSSFTINYGDTVYSTTLGITRNNVTFVGKGKDTTTILGGLAIVDQENIMFKQMTVTNTSVGGMGIHIDRAKVELTDVAVKNGGWGTSSGLHTPTYNYSDAETIVVATRCEFANSRVGAAVAGNLTSATFKNCLFYGNHEGINAANKSTIHLHGEATAIHSNSNQGIFAYMSSKVFIHLPSSHNTFYNNGNEDRYSSHNSSITNVED